MALCSKNPCPAPDYLDDFVCSRTISICTLIAATFPFIRWVTFVLFKVDWIADQPIFYFLFYMLLSLLVYIFVIIPLQIGNKVSSKPYTNQYQSPSVYSYFFIILLPFIPCGMIRRTIGCYWYQRQPHQLPHSQSSHYTLLTFINHSIHSANKNIKT